jgi:hypothetical protein
MKIGHKPHLVLAVILALIGGTLYFFPNWLSYSKYLIGVESQTEKNMRLLEQMEKKYIQAMTADTYGGKTPKETLDMFVDALRKGDVELASKYVKLEDDLTRDTTVATLSQMKEKGFLDDMAIDLSADIREDKDDKTSAEDFKFAAYNKDGDVGAIIDMWFNKYSGLWKIETL